MKKVFLLIIICPVVFLSFFTPDIILADNKDKTEIKRDKTEIETTLEGQIKFSLSSTDYKPDSIQSEVENNQWIDSNINLRIKTTTFINDTLSFNCHYVLSGSKGDFIKASNLFHAFNQSHDSDDTKLMDLSSKIKQGNDHLIFHKLDRFNLTMEKNFWRMTLGRQAVTWGNGLLFNPMDIFNPFSPYDTEQDYKKGDDMVCFEIFFKDGDDLQFVYLPRRDVLANDIKLSQSSLAMKYHLLFSDTEFDFMVAKHFNDMLTGVGCVRTLGNAVLRADLLYNFVDNDNKTRDNFFNLVVNIDYSWVLLNKNFYGFVEYYYSGIGTDTYSEIYTDPDFSMRINRGDIYGYGKNYLSINWAIELSPLLNLNIAAIANMDDPSYFFLPQITWNAAQNIEITLGSKIAIGGEDDEYGQIQLPFSSRKTDSGSSLFLWVTMFF